MKKFLRLSLAIFSGNLLGYAAFRAAAWYLPQLWSTSESDLSLSRLIMLIAVSAIMFAAPPVIVGACVAKVAAHHELFAGLAASLWGLSAFQWWPHIPNLPDESWLAPMTLIFISGLMGAWVMIGFRSPTTP